MSERGTSGNKYHRKIYNLAAHGDPKLSVMIDVYSVLTAFAVESPGLQHAIKKLLCSGIRNKGSRLQDLREARDALDRAIEDAERDEPKKIEAVPNKTDRSEELRDLIQHCWVHSGYANCGYDQMHSAMRKLYDEIISEERD